MNVAHLQSYQGATIAATNLEVIYCLPRPQNRLMEYGVIEMMFSFRAFF